MSTVVAATGDRAGLAAADWEAIAADLDASGCAVTPRLLTPAQCRDLAVLYDQPDRFRSTIDMARHRFGSGQYRYFLSRPAWPSPRCARLFTRTRW